MALKTWSQYHAIATTTGASGLALITDATSDTDPLGTACDSTYWEAHAYDALEVIFSTLGSSPGSGIDGTVFTINADAVSPENLRIDFNQGSAVGSRPFIRWDTFDLFQFNRDVLPYSDSAYDFGGVDRRWATIFADVVDATTLTGAISATGTTGDSFTIDSDDTIYTAGTGDIKLAASRGADAQGDAELYWSEGDDIWYLRSPDTESATPTIFVARKIVRYDDVDSIVVAMLDESSIYAGSGGDYGIASEAAREDHVHATGPETSSGTESETYTIDSNYASGSVNIELRFGAATNYIRFDPTVGDFVFSADLISDTHDTDNIGLTGTRWKNLFLSGYADIDGALDVAGALTVGGAAYFNTAFVTLDNDWTGGSSGLKVRRSEYTWITLHWDEPNARWELQDTSGVDHTLVSHDQVQTLSNKTLASPALITGGSWSGDPTFSGSPVFSSTPSFTNNPTFSGTPVFSGKPSFTYAYYTEPPFSIGTNTYKVVNLNADLLDGLSSLAFLRANGSVAMSGNLDMGGNNITNLGSLTAHQSTHMFGGADLLSGALPASVTGIAGTGVSPVGSWRVGTNSASGTLGNIIYLGGGGDHFITKTSLGSIGVGAADIDLVPGGTSSNQDLGQTSRRWRSGFFNNQIVFQQIATTEPSGIENGSSWVVDGGVLNDYLSKLRIRLGSTSLSIIDQNNKTHMIGSVGAWTVAGAIGISSGTITGITDLAVADGGTGASDAATARTNLGLGTIATQANSFGGDVTGTVAATVVGNDSHTHSSTVTLAGDVTGAGNATVVGDDSHAHTTTTISALDGGDITTGTIADARIASTIARDSEVAAGYQPLDAGLTSIAALSAYDDYIIVGDGVNWVSETGATARTSLGLTIGTHVQAYDVELAALAGLTSAANGLPYFTGSGTAALTTLSAFGRSLIDDADAATARGTLDAAPTHTHPYVGTSTNFVGDVTGPYSATVVGDDSHAHTGSTISSLAAGDITSGLMSVARGGTNYGSFTDAQFISYNAGAVRLESSGYTGASFSAIGHTHNYQPVDADLTAIAALSSADGNFIVGSAGGWVAESGATALTSIGAAASSHSHSYFPYTGGTEWNFIQDGTFLRLRHGTTVIESWTY